jgi:hypothetical protein
MTRLMPGIKAACEAIELARQRGSQLFCQHASGSLITRGVRCLSACTGSYRCRHGFADSVKVFAFGVREGQL